MMAYPSGLTISETNSIWLTKTLSGYVTGLSQSSKKNCQKKNTVADVSNQKT